jgi:predicted RNA polymerase sigma factor
MPTGRMTDVALEVVFRESWGRLLALLVAQYRRLDLAEDGLADAFEAAARTWRTGGVPDNPAAWLLTAARRRIMDRLRAEAVAARKEPLLVVDEEVRQSAAGVMADPGGLLVDERLRLVYLCAHPSLAREAAAALSLRLVLGVPTPDIATLFLVPEATMAARLTRAKHKLAASGAPFAVPVGDARASRTATVLAVVYLAFTAGYAPGTGRDVTRVEVAGEAIRLARVLRELLPGDPSVDALLALMLLQHSRREARVGEEGLPVLLPDQDRTRWRHDEIAEALALLTPMMGGGPPPGRPAGEEFLLQALIAAEHAIAPTPEATRWDRIAAHYAELEGLTGSPVVRLNRAVAVAEDQGPQAGLAVLEGLEEQLLQSHRLAAVRGELLLRAGRPADAVDAFAEAISLCANSAERALLEARRADAAGAREADCTSGGSRAAVPASGEGG